jgi:hypothetical protein
MIDPISVVILSRLTVLCKQLNALANAAANSEGATPAKKDIDAGQMQAANTLLDSHHGLLTQMFDEYKQELTDNGKKPTSTKGSNNANQTSAYFRHLVTASTTGDEIKRLCETMTPDARQFVYTSMVKAGTARPKAAGRKAKSAKKGKKAVDEDEEDNDDDDDDEAPIVTPTKQGGSLCSSPHRFVCDTLLT